MSPSSPQREVSVHSPLPIALCPRLQAEHNHPLITEWGQALPQCVSLPALVVLGARQDFTPRTPPTVCGARETTLTQVTSALSGDSTRDDRRKKEGSRQARPSLTGRARRAWASVQRLIHVRGSRGGEGIPVPWGRTAEQHRLGYACPGVCGPAQRPRQQRRQGEIGRAAEPGGWRALQQPDGEAESVRRCPGSQEGNDTAGSC